MLRRKPVEYAKARELRGEGWSVKAIARELGVAQSTVSLWVRDLGPLVFPTTRRAPGAAPAAPARGIPIPRSRELAPAGTLTRLVIWRSGRVRQCSKCKMLLPLECFNRAGDGRQHYCRECFKAYFRGRGSRHTEQVDTARRARRRQARRIVDTVLREATCADCGLAEADVLEFDHVGPKEANVSALAWDGVSESRLRAEIAQCEIVCRNCHLRRTARRRNSRRTGDWRARLDGVPGGVRRGLEYVYGLLEASACTDCGTRGLEILEFDHVGEKTANVTRLIWEHAALPRIVAEIGGCEIVCGNCHRRRTRRRLRDAGPPPVTLPSPPTPNGQAADF